MINMYNTDCMEFMADKPDNYYDLAIVDPPYGIMDKIISGGNADCRIKLQKGLEKFNDVVPKKEYFYQLRRISKNQIIWGGNYFVKHLYHSRGWIVWDKTIPDGMNFAKAELAFTSFNRNLEMFRPKKTKKTFHPTEKPVELYRWLLKNYAKKGDKILDTHGGSGSICIACHDMGFDIDWMELDKDYFNSAKKRYEKHIEQIRMF